MGGGSAGSSARDSGGAMGGGAGGSGGRVPAGGVTGSGGAAGSGESARTGGASGYGGAQDGGDVDSPIAIDTDGRDSFDGGPEGDSGLHCVGTASTGGCWFPCDIPGCYEAIPPNAGCSGSPVPCSSHSSEDCTYTGCVWLPAGSCSGTPSHCDQRSLAADCAGQAGCTWTPLPDGGTCIAAPDPCSKNSNQVQCSAQTGCTWSNAVCLTSACSVNTTSAACQAAGCSWYGTAACTGGTARSCTEYFSYSECYMVSGCSWTGSDMNCYGRPTPCSQLSVADCARQPGCTLSTP